MLMPGYAGELVPSLGGDHEKHIPAFEKFIEDLRAAWAELPDTEARMKKRPEAARRIGQRRIVAPSIEDMAVDRRAKESAVS